MNVLTDTFRGLIRRRLWPLAVLLLAALAAVPMLLAKDPAPAPAPATPVTGAAAAAPSAQTALVSAGDDAQAGRRRYVLGAKKDPFAPAPLPKAKKHRKQKTAAAAATPAPSEGSGSASGGTPPASSAPVPVPAPAAPSYPANSLTVRFGSTSGTPTERTLQVEHALPSTNNPVLVYMGLQDGGKTAVFMVGADVTQLEGDGRCTPDAKTCDTLRLKAGDTEFINVGKTQYELDLEKIHAATATSATAATAHAARRAKRPKVHF
ncbi:MAG TPA: hypothetical protein VH418_04340 [Solirubrobacteraceae bacterium]|jgi:hypothetical protein